MSTTTDAQISVREQKLAKLLTYGLVEYRDACRKNRRPMKVAALAVGFKSRQRFHEIVSNPEYEKRVFTGYGHHRILKAIAVSCDPFLSELTRYAAQELLIYRGLENPHKEQGQGRPLILLAVAALMRSSLANEILLNGFWELSGGVHFHANTELVAKKIMEELTRPSTGHSFGGLIELLVKEHDKQVKNGIKDVALLLTQLGRAGRKLPAKEVEAVVCMIIAAQAFFEDVCALGDSVYVSSLNLAEHLVEQLKAAHPFNEALRYWYRNYQTTELEIYAINSVLTSLSFNASVMMRLLHELLEAIAWESLTTIKQGFLLTAWCPNSMLVGRISRLPEENWDGFLTDEKQSGPLGISSNYFEWQCPDMNVMNVAFMKDFHRWKIKNTTNEWREQVGYLRRSRKSLYK